ncbi:MAG: polysaccharide biosynthesis C-terminal domain-containing protein, partial [Bacteroidales bacterium]
GGLRQASRGLPPHGMPARAGGLRHTIGCILTIIAVYALKSIILLQNPNPLFIKYYDYLIPLIVSGIFFLVYEVWLKNFYNVTIAIFLKETFQRILILIFLVLFMLKLLKFESLTFMYMLSVFVPSLLLLFFIASKGFLPLQLSTPKISKELRTEMISVGLFYILSGISVNINVNIDKIMLNSLMNMSAGGVYATAALFGVLVSAPSRPLKKITSIKLAEFWKEDNFKGLEDVYYKSVMTQSVIGGLLMLGILVNIDNIFQFLPHEYKSGKWVVVFICITNFLEMASGASSSLLLTSKKYKSSAYMSILLLGLLIGLNFIFIPIYGLDGAAFATLIAFLIFHVMRSYYIYHHYKLLPYKKSFYILLLLTATIYFLVSSLSFNLHFIIDMFIKGTAVCILFIPSVYILSISDDINNIIDMFLKKIKHVFEKNLPFNK